MGTWGTGVYSNDTALDWLGDLIESVSKEIRKGIEDFDESSGEALLAAADTIRVLCENSGAAPPKATEVDGWHMSYLRCWESYITGLDPKEGFVEAQRDVINDVFSRLSQVALSFWDRKQK
jgi:hypothetical protein